MKNIKITIFRLIIIFFSILNNSFSQEEENLCNNYTSMIIKILTSNEEKYRIKNYSLGIAEYTIKNTNTKFKNDEEYKKKIKSLMRLNIINLLNLECLNMVLIESHNKLFTSIEERNKFIHNRYLGCMTCIESFVFKAMITFDVELI